MPARLIEDELSDEQRNRFEQHLAGCDDCRDELEEFRKLKAITDEVLIYGGFRMIEEIVRDPAIGFGLKAGLLAMIAGLAILFVSVVRERLHFWSKDRYKDVRR